MALHIPLDQLESHAFNCLGAGGKLTGIHLRPLEGGYVSAGVYRIALEFRLPDATTRTVDYVQKYTNLAEARLMNALNRSMNNSAVPQVIASDETADPAWFVTPWYPGPALTWEDALPPAILRLLAAVHAHFEGRGAEFPGVPLLDADFFRRTIDLGIAALVGDAFAVERARLERIRENPKLYAALASFPLTLVHGDVHPGNILKSSEGFVLIDWGTARIAPAMLDIANMVEMGSNEWDIYLSAWEEASARKADPRLTVLSYHWATIQVNVQYLGWVVEHRSADKVRSMVQRACEAEEKINKSVCVTADRSGPSEA